MRQKMRILNAHHLSGGDNSMLYPTITPVNSFRLVLNRQFGENLELLPDKDHVFGEFRRPYKFLEVTDRLKGD